MTTSVSPGPGLLGRLAEGRAQLADVKLPERVPTGDAAILLERLWNIDQLADAAEFPVVSINAGA